ncbi:flocculation protein FLO11-like [Lactuca sativa]|uniref:flocculation protein FLO11-like n=1 Tax=Lactuca sativa TaxID=4236 RepID=UPI000CD9028E|nr:flocculation protein FLO11-like [Lactuca sativa]
MIHSIEEADKPTKRVKKQEKKKEERVTKVAKGQTARKRKSEKAAPSQPKQKKTKKPTRKLILQSSSDSDSEYIPTGHKQPTPSAFERKVSDDEGSVRGNTPPRSPTPEVQVRSKAPSPPPVSIPISLPSNFPVITSQPSSTIPIPTPIFTDTTTATTTEVQTNVSDTRVRSSVPESSKPLSPTRSTETNNVLGDAPPTKRHLKAVTDKLDQLLSKSSADPHSEAALKALFSSAIKEHDTSISNAAKAVDASTSQCQKDSLAVEASTKYCKEVPVKVEKLVSEAQIFLDSLQTAAQKNAHSLEAELAVENKVMDELDKRTSHLKMQNLKLRTETEEINDLNSERENGGCFGDHYSSEKQGGEKKSQGKTDKTQPPPPPETKATAGLKDNVASASKGEKKKKIIGEYDDIDDIIKEGSSKPDPKFKPSDQELKEKMDRL